MLMTQGVTVEILPLTICQNGSGRMDKRLPDFSYGIEIQHASERATPHYKRRHPIGTRTAFFFWGSWHWQFVTSVRNAPLVINLGLMSSGWYLLVEFNLRGWTVVNMQVNMVAAPGGQNLENRSCLAANIATKHDSFKWLWVSHNWEPNTFLVWYFNKKN